ncbi:MAG: hypothetical protein P8Y64_08320 [Gammaproteobacteria bacterium]
MNIFRLWQWLVEIWRWLVEAKLVFMCILVITASVSLGMGRWHSEFSIRSAGWGLQIIGMIFAARGLLNIRVHFGKPMLSKLLFAWIKRFPKYKRSIVVSPSVAHMMSLGMTARAEVWHPDDKNMPIAKRVDVINRNLEIIRIEQREQAKLIDELKDSHEQYKGVMAERTNKMEEDIRSDIESLYTSDLITSLVGLVWLTVGITMSTMAPELYTWIYQI